MDISMKVRKVPSKIKTTRSSTTITSKAAKKRRKPNASKYRNCVCMPLTTSPVEFSPVWEELRINGQLCDGTVHCEDGVDFRIHRAILSAVSPYFKALFTNSINRGKTDTKEANVNVCSKIFKILLNYAYTGICAINDENVENLLMYADQYEILGVVQLCCKYLMDQLCPSNCLGILQFASQYFCKDLVDEGRLYVRHKFSKLLKESSELVYVTEKDLMDILSDDELNIKSEELVFDAIKKWVEFDPRKRKHNLLKLIKCIRFGNLSYESVYNMKQWSLIENDTQCKTFMTDMLNVIEDATIEKMEQVDNQFFRPRIPYDILFAVGGWSAGSPTNFVETYDVRADRWLLSSDTDTTPRAYHGLCTLNGLVYMIGGFDGSEYFNTVRCFDPVTHAWRECACMYYPRCYVSVVKHASKIYAMGGFNGRIRMNTAERYDPEQNQWELIAPMQRQRSDASAAALRDKIYIAGGFDGQEVMNSVEVFDPSANQWSYIPQMMTARSGVSLVSFQNTLYAIGGFNGYTRLITGERYTPGSSAVWSEIADMMTPRSNFATVILDDFIYVIGGFNGSTTINYVEYYDSETNEWFDAAPMNLNRSALSACVLSGLPNALEYSVLGRSHKEVGQGAGNP